MAWFIVPYARRPGARPRRYPAIDDYTDQIRAAGGTWSETEVLGDRCLVKVRAPSVALAALADRFRRLPMDRLDDSLAALSPTARAALRNELEDMGYTLDEIRERFGYDVQLEDFTLGDVLRFMARRRRKPRYDRELDEIVLDGPVQSCRPVDSVDAEVR